MRHISLTPGYIGNMEVRNRIVYPAMVANYCGPEGEVTDRFIAYHRERARGGCGLLIMEASRISEDGRGFPGHLGVHDDRLLPGLRKLVNEIHKAGAKIAVQLCYPGRQNSIKWCRQIPYSPSGTSYNGEESRALPISEIERIARDYGEAAARAKEAGFDSVEVHGGNGYLLQQFHSRFTNQREDEYGGSLGNRIRFSRNVLREIRKKVGPNFPVILRLGMKEPVENGLSLTEGMAIAKLLAEEQIDALDITAGMREGAYFVTPPACLPEGTHLDLARIVKENIPHIPVIGIGRILTVEAADRAIDGGAADFVVMGRAQIADPHLIAKTTRGKAHFVTPCLSCNDGCMWRVSQGQPLACVINPRVGKESEPPTKTDKPLTVVIIGAGPAGCVAALAASAKGHKVTLLEKEHHIGGKLYTASLPPHKYRLEEYARYLDRSVRNSGIDLRLGLEATPEIINELQPDHVIVAAGAIPSVPGIPGLEQMPYILAEKVLTMDPTSLPENIIILGGGMVGAECAEKLSLEGKSVTIVEMRPSVALDVEPRTRTLLLKRLNELGVKCLVSKKILAINADCIELEEGNQKMLLPVKGQIILALGYRADHSLAETLSKLGITVVEIGDSKMAGSIINAVAGGYVAGNAV